MLFTLPAAAQVQPEILAGPIINPANGHSYYLLTQDSWPNSENRAVALGGHLVTINNQAEQDWIYSTFADTDRSLWIGLNDAISEGNFQWVSGQPLDYTHWAQNAPDNYGGLDEDFVQTFPSKNLWNTGFWNDLPLGPERCWGVVEVESEPEFLRDGLVAYYPFNGNANDETGNGKNGQIIGNVTQAEDRFGRQSSAYQFAGVNSTINVTQPVFNIGKAGYTISGWFCTDDVNMENQSILYCVPDSGLSLMYHYGPPQVGYYAGPATGNWTEPFRRGAKTDYSNQTWYHLTLTKNGTVFTLYSNGQVDTQQIISVASGYNYEVGYRLGSHPEGTHFFKGRLDDFRIYNRALSEEEVKGLYDYESKPASGTATATPQVVNGFVVGATVTYGGVDYIEAPNITIFGGGGSGATATATISKGAVTAITS